MASFYGSIFTYDNISSVNYNLRILGFDSGESTGKSVDLTLFKDELYKKIKSNFYGVSVNAPKEFTLTVGSLDPMTAIDRNLIEGWLLGKQNYAKLRIIQNDMTNIYYNCVFATCVPKFIGNGGVAYELNAICDSPFAWQNSNVLTKTYSAPVNETFNFYNPTSYQGYTDPIIEFTVSSTGSGVTITNLTDDAKTGNSRPFIWSGLLPNENIKVNNYTKVITTSSGLFRLNKFNLKYFRLVKGMNSININGDISLFKMTTDFAHSVGA